MKNFISINGDETQEEKLKRVILNNKISIAAVFILSISAVFIKSYYESSVINNSKISANAEYSIGENGYDEGYFNKLNDADKYNALDDVIKSSELSIDKKVDILTSLRSSDKILNNLIEERVVALLISIGEDAEALLYAENLDKKTSIIYSYLGDMYSKVSDGEKAKSYYQRAKVLSISSSFRDLMDTKVFSIDIINVNRESK